MSEQKALCFLAGIMLVALPFMPLAGVELFQSIAAISLVCRLVVIAVARSPRACLLLILQAFCGLGGLALLLLAIAMGLLRYQPEGHSMGSRFVAPMAIFGLGLLAVFLTSAVPSQRSRGINRFLFFLFGLALCQATGSAAFLSIVVVGVSTPGRKATNQTRPPLLDAIADRLHSACHRLVGVFSVPPYGSPYHKTERPQPPNPSEASVERKVSRTNPWQRRNAWEEVNLNKLGLRPKIVPLLAERLGPRWQEIVRPEDLSAVRKREWIVERWRDGESELTPVEELIIKLQGAA